MDLLGGQENAIKESVRAGPVNEREREPLRKSRGCHGILFNLALAGDSRRLVLARDHWNCRDRATEEDTSKACDVRAHEERICGVLLDLSDFRMDRARCTR